MADTTRHAAIFLPGILMPAAVRYQALVRELGDDVAPVLKELEVYAGPAVPAPYSVDIEVEGVLRAADAAGLGRFHLYGHSAGGAVALAFAARFPGRLLSLALDEPASDFSDSARQEMQALVEELAPLPVADRMAAFARAQLSPDAELPPPPSGPAPSWMSNRAAGVDAFVEALMRHGVDQTAWRRFEGPVYFSHGSLSNQRWQAMRDRLAATFPNFRSELYAGLHHMNTSHAADPARVAVALKALWQTR